MNYNLNNKESIKLDTLVDKTLKMVEDNFRDCPDVVYKKIYLNGNEIGYFIYIEGLVDLESVQRDFFTPILNMDYTAFSSEERIRNIPAISSIIYWDVGSIIHGLLNRNTIFILNGIEYAIA